MTPWHYTERLLPLFPHSPPPPTTTNEDRHVRTRALRKAWRSSKWSGVQYRTSSKATAIASRNETRWHHVGSLNLMNALLPPRVVAGMDIHCPCAYIHSRSLSFNLNGILLCNFNHAHGRLGCKIIITYTYVLFVELTTRANILYNSQQFKCSDWDKLYQTMCISFRLS